MAVDWQVYYRVNDDNSGPELLLEVFRERGWQPWEDSQPNNINEETNNNNSAKFSSASSNTNNRYDDSNGFRNYHSTNKTLANSSCGSNKISGQMKTHDYSSKASKEYTASSSRRASCSINAKMNGTRGTGRNIGYNSSCSLKNHRTSENCAWHLWWRHGFPLSLYTRLQPDQILSHIPKGQGLCRKDSLTRSLQNMRKTFGAIYDFYPTTFLLPCEYTKLVAEYTKLLHHNTPSTCCSSSKSTTPSTTPPSSRRRSNNPKETRVSSQSLKNSTKQNTNSSRRSFPLKKSQSDQNIEESTTSNIDSGYGSTDFKGCQNYVTSSDTSQDCKSSSWYRKMKDNQSRRPVAQHLNGDLSSHYIRDEVKEANVWICKPTTSSQGRGITIFEDVHELKYGDSAVVQRYIERPLLVGGYKCDLRLYVLVTSLSPLTVYLYREGIVRFSTEKYSMASLERPYCHLTNTSLNKSSPGYSVEKDRVGSGCKWSLRQLRHHLRTSGVSDWLLWQKISCIVSLTLLAHVTKLRSESMLPHGMTNCFELYGFDVLVDEKFKPWLLEVNRCPSLSYDCDVDRYVKKPMLHHLFDLLGPPRVAQPIEKLLNPPPKLSESVKTWESSVSGSSGEDGEHSSYNGESEDEASKENDACLKILGNKCNFKNNVSSEERKLDQDSDRHKEDEAAACEAVADSKFNGVQCRKSFGKFSFLDNTKRSQYKIRKLSSKPSRSNSQFSNISRYSYSINSDKGQNDINRNWETVRGMDGQSNMNVNRESKLIEQNIEFKIVNNKPTSTDINEGAELQLVSDNDDETEEKSKSNSECIPLEQNYQLVNTRKRTDLAVQLEGSTDKNIFPGASGRVSRIREIRFNRKIGSKSSVKRRRTSAHVKSMSITNRLYYNKFSDEYWRQVMGNSAKKVHIDENKRIPQRLNSSSSFSSKKSLLCSSHRLSQNDGLILANETSNPPLEITRVSLSPPLRSTSSPVERAPSFHHIRSNLEPKKSTRKVTEEFCESDALGKPESCAGQVAEEVSSDTYVPVAFNSSFQRLRRQLLGVAIDSGRCRSNFSSSSSQRKRKDDWSLSGVEGGWVRTFPFNTSTAHATKHPLQVRAAVLEVHKYRKLCEKIFTSSKDALKSGNPEKKHASDQSSSSRLQHNEEKCSDSENTSISQTENNLPLSNSKFYYYRMNASMSSRKKVYTEKSSPASDTRGRAEGFIKAEPSSASAEDAAYAAQAMPSLWKDQIVWTPGF